MLILAVLAGGMLGAPARYLADRTVQARHDSVFPWGTFAVNVVGSAVLGFLLGAQRHLALPPAVFALLGTGFCGGLTTFSAFGYETLRLLEDGAIGEAGINVIGSLAIAVLVAWLGFRLAVALLVTVLPRGTTPGPPPCYPGGRPPDPRRATPGNDPRTPAGLSRGRPPDRPRATLAERHPDPAGVEPRTPHG